MANIVRLQWKESNKDLLRVIKGEDGLRPPKRTVFTASEPQPLGVGGATYRDMSMIIPLHEDITLQFQSEFGDIGDNLPAGIKSMLDMAKSFTALGGVTSDTFAMFGFQQWKSTSPVSIQLQLGFYTNQNSWYDVWLPIVSLSTLTTLSVITDSKSGKDTRAYRTPGVSLGNLGEANKAKTTDASAKPANNTSSGGKDVRKQSNLSKMIDVFIPGVIAMNNAFVESAHPTFSHQKTKSGGPLWGTIQLNIKSLFPAYDQMLTNVSINGLRAGQRDTVLSKVTNLFR